jgi:hypothetical protein
MSEQEFSASESNGRVEPSRRKPLLVGLFCVAGLVVFAILGVWAYNEVTLQKPLNKVLLSDPRNNVVQARARFDGWVDSSTLVFELTDVKGEASQMDVFRVLLQYAREQKDRRFERVILSAFGNKKFVVPGDYFQQLGQEYDAQNPVYTVRKFPTHILTMDGAQPFPEPRGGLLWVLKEEMEQFSDFNRRWYLDDFIARQK